MADINKKKTKLALAVGILLTFGLSGFASASTTTSETEHYLVIATGGQSSSQDHFFMSNAEIGANQEFLSVKEPPNGGSQILGKFDSADQKGFGGGVTLNNKGFDISAANLAALEGKNYSGNVALIGDNAKANFSNADVNAIDNSVNSGVLCANSANSECAQDNTAFFEEGTPNTGTTYGIGNGATSGVDFSGANGLINDLAQQRDWILGLETDVTWDISDISQFDKGSMTNITTSIDGLNTNTSGENADYVVIDLDLGNSGYFNLNNVNWIIESLTGLTAIFRMADGQYYSFDNASIMLSDGTENLEKLGNGELGAIFYQDAYKQTNEIFNLSNVVLGGIGLWDFTDFNPNGKNGQLMKDITSVWTDHNSTETNITMDNAQGCGQFISNTVNMQNARWGRCALGSPSVDVPEPSTILLLALGLFGLRIRNKTV